MEFCDLYQVIESLEYGTNLHIGVVFLGNHGNSKCDLPHSHTIHSNEICENFKRVPKDFERCLKCRNLAIRRALRDKKPFGALCINGVYEYTRPVVIDGRVIAVIFVGNILTPEGKNKLLSRLSDTDVSFNTMEPYFDYEKCDVIGRIIEGHISVLLEKYPDEKRIGNPIIENIKSYVLSNLEYDLSISDIASLYFYSEVYLGRLFKESVGKSFKEYVNYERIKKAKQLLVGNMTVTEVSQKVGYNNVAYFNRVFKAQTGMTPTEFGKTIN